MPNCRLASYTLSATEVCILGMRGRVPKQSYKVKQVIMSPRERHSKKPDEIRNRIVELFGDLPRIELFAREKTSGWDVWGNEVESSIRLLTPLALDGGDSAASEQFPTPEVLSTLQGESTPAHRK